MLVLENNNFQNGQGLYTKISTIFLNYLLLVCVLCTDRTEDIRSRNTVPAFTSIFSVKKDIV